MDELIRLVDKINRRKIVEWQMQLAIVENPHKKDPQELWKKLNEQANGAQKANKLDSAAFEGLRFAMSKSPSFVVK